MKSFRKAIEGLESRRLMTSIKGTDVINLADTSGDGTKANGNDVLIKFNGTINSADLSKMRAFGYANDTINGGGNYKSTINILSATVEGTIVRLRTDVQVRKGSTFTFGDGAITATDGGVTGTVRTTKGLNRNRFTLALRAFKVREKTFFSDERIVGGTNPTTANTAASESSVRAALDAFLSKKINEGMIDSAEKTATMARFDNTAVKALVPAHNLRAGILSLVGTVAEPAIAYYLDKGNSTGKDLIQFDFSGSISSGAKISETSYTSTGRLKTLWNPNYAGESFVVLSGLIAHETVHEGLDKINSQDEEVIANTIESMVYAQQVVTDFTYSRLGTELTTRANYRLLLLLNSGDRQFPRIGIKAGPLKNEAAGAIPGMTPPFDSTPSSPIKSLEDDVREEFIARNVADKPGTTAYPTARAILGNITGQTYDSSWTFHDELIDDIDIRQGTLSDSYAMRVARVLQVSV